MELLFFFVVAVLAVGIELIRQARQWDRGQDRKRDEIQRSLR